MLQLNIITNKNSGKVCDVEGNSQDNGARIQQWDSFQSDNQKWIIESAGTELYKITAVSSAKVMDVVGGSDINNTDGAATFDPLAQITLD